MAGNTVTVDEGPFSVLIANDFGLDEFTVEVVQPDDRGVPTNVMPDTEYAFLSAQQSAAFWRGEFILEHQDEIRHLGAFMLRFDEAPDQPESVVLSHNRKSHLELIEKATRATS